jgi:hypothetical protein
VAQADERILARGVLQVGVVAVSPRVQSLDRAALVRILARNGHPADAIRAASRDDAQVQVGGPVVDAREAGGAEVERTMRQATSPA